MNKTIIRLKTIFSFFLFLTVCYVPLGAVVLEDFPPFFGLPPTAMLSGDYGLSEYRFEKIGNPEPKYYELSNIPVKLAYHPKNFPVWRIVTVSRSKAATALAENGMIRTGDVILTVRPEWGYRGSYPDMMMGVSHAGIALVRNGLVYNLDHPLGMNYMGNFDSKHYLVSEVLHVVRMRNLTQKQLDNLAAWEERIYDDVPKTRKIMFNPEYDNPLHSTDPYFVHKVGRIALGMKNTPAVNIFCAEFVWAVLSLRGCDPVENAQDFASDTPPACIIHPFKPLPAMGDYFANPGSGKLGFIDGALAVIRYMDLPAKEKSEWIHQVFVKARSQDVDSESQYPEGPYYDGVEPYYQGIEKNTSKATGIKTSYNASVVPNYPPTAFLLNTLLPSENPNRVFDVVGTIVFE